MEEQTQTYPDPRKDEEVRKQEAMEGSPGFVSDELGFLNIKFQCGPIKDVGINGVQIDYVLELLKNRLEGFQKGPFRCRENALAITKIAEAIMWLNERTKLRMMQCVEGVNKPHESPEREIPESTEV